MHRFTMCRLLPRPGLLTADVTGLVPEMWLLSCVTADSRALPLGALGGPTTGKSCFLETPVVSQSIRGGGVLRLFSPSPCFTDGKLGVSDSKLSSLILAMIGKEVQKRDNHHLNHVLLSAKSYSVLRIPHASFCLLFRKTLQVGVFINPIIPPGQ